MLRFNLVRELLFNVVKHARVREATVTLHKTHEQLALTVENFGAGFDLGARRHHRVRVVGRASAAGTLRVRVVPAPDKGTRVAIVIPARVLTLG